MSSLVVHAALAGLLAAALLADAFDRRSLGIAVLAVLVVDLDVFLAPVLGGVHRAAGHTLVWPLLVAVGLLVVARLDAPAVSPAADRAGLAARLGARWRAVAARIVAVRTRRRLRVAWMTVAVVIFAGIGPDLVSNGANLFWPIHDQFYTLDGKIELSTTRGLVQTVVDLSPDPAGDPSTTENKFYSSGVDPTRGEEPENVERVFPIAWSGLEILLIVASIVVVTVRLLRN
ncbi:MAG: metal-dependent hydrolase [Halococcoides sp.]